MDWNCTEGAEKDFNEMMKLLTEVPCLAHSAREPYNVATTDARRTGSGTNLWQKQVGNTI